MINLTMSGTLVEMILLAQNQDTRGNDLNRIYFTDGFPSWISKTATKYSHAIMNLNKNCVIGVESE